MSRNKVDGAPAVTSCLALLIAFAAGLMAVLSFDSEGGGSASGSIIGGAAVPTPSLSGNWSGFVSTPFGTGAFSLGISQSQSSISGSAQFGAPIFDAKGKLTAAVLNGTHFSGYVSSGEGLSPITGSLSSDGTKLSGTVIQGVVYSYVANRR
jgi:hypothetical protein